MSLSLTVGFDLGRRHAIRPHFNLNRAVFTQFKMRGGNYFGMDKIFIGRADLRVSRDIWAAQQRRPTFWFRRRGFVKWFGAFGGCLRTATIFLVRHAQIN